MPARRNMDQGLLAAAMAAIAAPMPPSPPEATGGIPEAGSKEVKHDDQSKGPETCAVAGGDPRRRPGRSRHPTGSAGDAAPRHARPSTGSPRCWAMRRSAFRW